MEILQIDVNWWKCDSLAKGAVLNTDMLKGLLKDVVQVEGA